MEHPKVGAPESRRPERRSDRNLPVSGQSFMGAAVGEQHAFQPGVGGQAVFERMIGGIVNEKQLHWA